MISFVALQNTYLAIEMALFRQEAAIDSETIPKAQASSLLIPRLEELLKRNNLSLSEISFLAVNQGPGPFTTLRVVIASANGISFAHSLPLVGVDALKAFLTEYHDDAYPCTIALLNAFNNDVYVGIQRNQSITTSCMNIQAFLEEVQQQIPQDTIRFLGNGATLFEAEIKAAFGEKAFIPSPTPQTCSINQIGRMGLEQWRTHQNVTNKLLPLYLKQFKPFQQAN